MEFDNKKNICHVFLLYFLVAWKWRLLIAFSVGLYRPKANFGSKKACTLFRVLSNTKKPHNKFQKSSNKKGNSLNNWLKMELKK